MNIDPSNTLLFDLALKDAPYVIWAYGILWAALCGYVTFILARMLKMEKEMSLLQETVEKKMGK